MFGEWAWTTRSDGKKEGVIDFQDNGQCKLYYTKSGDDKSRGAEIDWANDQFNMEGSNMDKASRYCQWAVNMKSPDKRLYIDWHMKTPVDILQDFDMAAHEQTDSTGKVTGTRTATTAWAKNKAKVFKDMPEKPTTKPAQTACQIKWTEGCPCDAAHHMKWMSGVCVPDDTKPAPVGPVDPKPGKLFKTR